MNIDGEKYPGSPQFFLIFVLDKNELLSIHSNIIKPLNNTNG
jgi:hypothetical protein